MERIVKSLAVIVGLLGMLVASALPTADQWLTRSEVAGRLRVPEKTLAQWASQRKGPPYKRFGRHTRYRLSECIAWENAQQAGGDAA